MKGYLLDSSVLPISLRKKILPQDSMELIPQVTSNEDSSQDSDVTVVPDIIPVETPDVDNVTPVIDVLTPTEDLKVVDNEPETVGNEEKENFEPTVPILEETDGHDSSRDFNKYPEVELPGVTAQQESEKSSEKPTEADPEENNNVIDTQPEVSDPIEEENPAIKLNSDPDRENNIPLGFQPLPEVEEESESEEIQEPATTPEEILEPVVKPEKIQEPVTKPEEIQEFTPVTDVPQEKIEEKSSPKEEPLHDKAENEHKQNIGKAEKPEVDIKSTAVKEPKVYENIDITPFVVPVEPIINPKHPEVENKENTIPITPNWGTEGNKEPARRPISRDIIIEPSAPIFENEPEEVPRGLL
eukprot:CAMPEP_0117010146 /NCGR_PEP_ID=MMETSP0472-20121206/9019_1 /TAXON_ID=693140 ORGANISM="Tiarina fusus, Strain LIS" /NCGR_SAMPLE_ID=MMETSP0472 /ASSEMBLY_ACC=CAM_ASM_000603 /LENGTH=356 /DNA_ID=CAMNT_0004712609 /DNA_START=227 /DNA_END=1294 /DNA_ORIENTATION=+